MWAGVVRSLTKMPITRGKNGPVRSSRACRTGDALRVACSRGVVATPPLSVQRYSLEEGLSQQAVNAIMQDTEGFMWFGTEDGLNRFDGYEFRQLRHDRGDPQRCPMAGSPRWSRATTACGSRPTAAASCSATRRPASSKRPRSCATRPICNACARWRATASAGCGSPRATPASRSSIRARGELQAPAPCGDAAAFARPTTPYSRILHLRSGDTLVGTATGLDRLSAANFDVTRVAAAAPSSRRRASRCACARSPNLPTAWCGSAPTPASARFDPRNDALARVPRESRRAAARCPTTACSRCSSTARAACGSASSAASRGSTRATETFSSYRRDDAEAAFAARRLHRLAVRGPRRQPVDRHQDRRPREVESAHLVVRPHARQRRGRLHRPQHHLVRRGQARPAVDRHLRRRHQPARPHHRRGHRRCATPTASRGSSERRPRHGACSKAATAACGSARWAAA